jgi:carbamoyl-phosphate synthase large subunit
MDKPVILISGVCGDIGCSAVRALREAAAKIIGCDMRPYSPVYDLIDQFYVIPGALDRENYMKSLRKILEKEGILFFLPIPEPEIRVADEKRGELEALGIKLLLNNHLIIDNFLDKLKTAQFIESIGLRAPKTALLQEYDGDFGYPLIVKPRSGYGSKRLWKIEDNRDLDYLRLKDDGNLIVQEHIGSDLEEYTTGVFSDGKKTSSITFRRKLGFGGLSTEAVLIDDQRVEELSVKVAEAANLIGGINIQSRRVDNTFIPFEINPRLSSTLLIRKRFGFDDAMWWLHILSGKSYSYKKAYKAGRVVRSVSECYFDMVKLDHGDR